jgi:tetratricopeptide (TPR) repeat protein
VAFAGEDSTRLTQETRLAKCHLDNQLRDGECTAYIDLMTRVGANAREDDYQFGQSIGPFIECAISALHNKDTKPWTREQCKAIGKALRGLLNDRDYVNINDFQAFSTVLVALSCQEDTDDEFNAWVKKVSDYNRSRIENGGVKNDVWRIGLRLQGPPTPENLDARMQFVKRATQLAFEKKWLSRNNQPYRIRGQEERNFLTAIVKSDLLTTDEVTANGAAMLAGLGPKEEPNYAQAAFANWLQSEKNFEKAAEVWRAIAKVEPEAKKVPRNEANYVLGLATCLKNLKRFDEALSTLSVLEGKDFDDALKASYKQYKQEIEAAKVEASNAGENDKPEAEPEKVKTSSKLRVLRAVKSEKFILVAGQVAV